MKYVFCIALVITLFLTGCYKRSENPTVESICRKDEQGEIAISLDQPDEEKLCIIWQEEKWSLGNIKVTYDYIFETSMGTIRYSMDAGVFNNITEYTYLELSEEQKECINNILLCEIDLP